AAPLERARGRAQHGHLRGHPLPLPAASRIAPGRRRPRMNAEADTEAALGRPERDAVHNLCLADPVWTERYEGWTELGHGGSATVVRTRGKALDEDLALKVFPRLSRDGWTRVPREGGTAAR